MPVVNFIHPSGKHSQVEFQSGNSLMETAVKASIPEIFADCGGVCVCSTCHVYVDQQWSDQLNPPNDMETELLTCVPDPTEFSRLSCQIKMTEDLDGMIVHLPAEQA